MSASLAVRDSTEPPEGWDALVRRTGTFYHQSAWLAALRAAFGFRLHCLSAFRGAALVGVLPLAEVPGLTGRRLVSLPFSYAAGPAAEPGEAAVVRELMQGARELAVARRARRVEVKRLDQAAPPAAGFERVHKYSTFLLDTSGGEAAVWDGLHASSTRRSIRKAERAGLVVERGTSPEQWRAMAVLEEATAHGHGLPAPPRGFFVEVCRRLQEQGYADLYLARDAAAGGSAPAAGIVLWKGPRSWIYAFGASRAEMLERRPNHLLIWTAIRDAIAAGVSFDLGRASPEQRGLVEFKERWGARAVPLAYDYAPSAGGLNTMRRDSGMLATFGRVWTKLPAPIARAGSFLYRYLG